MAVLRVDGSDLTTHWLWTTLLATLLLTYLVLVAAFLSKVAYFWEAMAAAWVEVLVFSDECSSATVAAADATAPSKEALLESGVAAAFSGAEI